MKNGDFPEDKLKNANVQMRSVWSLSAPKTAEKKFGKHPTQKPEDLLRRIILASTNEGDIVLDPFTGSSTTGLMAYRWGRSFIGVDTEEPYLALSVKRFEEMVEKMVKPTFRTSLPIFGNYCRPHKKALNKLIKNKFFRWLSRLRLAIYTT